MGIPLASSFTMNAALPLDDRTVVADITARDAILAGKRYEMMVVSVLSVGTNYQLVGGITNSDWQEFSGSGGSGAAEETGKILLVNNSANTVAEIGEYLTDCSGIIVEYYIYRRTDSGFKKMRGELRLETQPDEVLSADRWALIESNRSEFGGDSGVTFSLTEIDTEKSILVVTLDNMAGAAHQCKFYYKVIRFNNASGKIIILANNSINPISSIGEYLDSAGGIIIDYFVYRRTDAGYKKMRGKILMEGNPDAVLNPDKWTIIELERSEGLSSSGVTFTLDDVDTEKSILVITLDNMAGSGHRCDFYYTKTVLSN